MIEDRASGARHGLHHIRIDHRKDHAPGSFSTMHLYANERTALFIDGANLYATAKALAFDIDFRRFTRFFQGRCILIRSLYYTTLADEREYSSIRPLLDWLDYNGFYVVTKPMREFTDSTGKRKLKGSIAVELTIDALVLAESLDHVVLFSGDGDFCSLIGALQQRGKRVSVVSTLQSQPAMVADDLRRKADQFIDLADLVRQVGRPEAMNKSTIKTNGNTGGEDN